MLTVAIIALVLVGAGWLRNAALLMRTETVRDYNAVNAAVLIWTLFLGLVLAGVVWAAS